jgi:alkanesulfonate monooxygenase SsuD/methylene tetrahydromethanopterin reductase-like flavin-dependent oxidoreductase (luciferase family)
MLLAGCPGECHSAFAESVWQQLSWAKAHMQTRSAPMRINLMIEPQEGMTYTDILTLARHAEDLGFEGLYRSDHYASVFGQGAVGSTDAWATLAGLARETQRIVLGTLVSPVTFRPAANLAKVVATVAEMAGTSPLGAEDPSGSSRGDRLATAARAPRVHLGIGTGWLATEHTTYGFAFEDLGTRFRRLEEHLQILRGLWDSRREPFSFDGKFERIKEAHFLPRPEPRPRIIVGGRGPVKTVRLAVLYADELNSPSATPEECSKLRAVLEAACERHGRDPSTITFSLMTGCLVGATVDDFQARERRLEKLAASYPRLREHRERLAIRGIVGTPERAVDRLGQLAEAGVQRVMMQHLFHDDLDLLNVVAEEIAPRLSPTSKTTLGGPAAGEAVS